VTDLKRLRETVFAALGVASCSASPAGEPVLVDLPPPGTSTATVGAPQRPPRTETGYVSEADGTVHRASATTCDATIGKESCRGDEGHRQCETDADCTSGPNGKCVTDVGQIGAYCGCEYACETDADCKAEEACVCAAFSGQSRSVCAPATCRADADCESGRCGVSAFFNGCWTSTRLSCRSDADKCTSDADCVVGDRKTGSCRAGEDGWRCENVACAIGRPFIVSGAARAAPSAKRTDWLDEALADSLSPGAGAADEATRGVVSRTALAVAAMEHASVASFARASLELLALGAPPGLVADTHAAAADEVRHARTAFAVARAYGASETGPGALSLGGVALETRPAEVAYAVAFEGCVGETLGAAEARAAADGCGDEALRSAWSGVADDEARHAALAWRTLAWLCRAFGDEARDAARRGLRAGLDAMVEGPGAVVSDPGAPAHGVLSARDVWTLREATARTVIEPAAEAVLRTGANLQTGRKGTGAKGPCPLNPPGA
jgi:hypothetical protein